MKVLLVDEAAPPLVLEGLDVVRVHDEHAAHVAIIHVPRAVAARRVADARATLRPAALILAATDGDDEDHLELLLTAGADDHIVWPRDRRALRARLHMLDRRLRRRNVSGPIAVPHEVIDEPSQRRTLAMQVEWRQRYETAVRASGQLLYDYDQDTGHVTCAGSPSSRFGYNATELAGPIESWIARLHPDDREAYRAELARAFETRQPFILAYRVRHRDGGWIMVEDRGHLVGPRLVGFIVDVSGRERAVEALRASEARLSAIIDLAHDAIFMKDTHGRYTLINPVGARYFSRTQAECLGRTDIELLGPERAADIVAADREVMATRAPKVYESRRLTNERETAYSTSKVPFLAPDGTMLGIIGIAHDVTERKRMEAQLFLSERMVSVGTLAAGVAHEINNPLAYVIGNLDYARGRLADVMSGRAEPAELTEVLQSLDDSIEGTTRMRDIVRDLRTFGRADEDERSPVDIWRVVDVAVRMTQHAVKHRAQVIKEVRAVPLLLGSASRLGQVLVNLLINSAQAMPLDRDAERNEIRISAHSEGGLVTLELLDNGVGIPEEARRRIFDPFFTTKPVGVGTGLGLWICHNIVVAMGGNIDVESEPGVGSIFRVSMPVVQAGERPHVDPRPTPRPSRMRPRLLVVDDEPRMAAGLRRMLSDENDVVPLTDAREALARIHAGERFDAVLCDLMMPGMNGMEFYAELARVAPGMAARTGFVTGGALTDGARVFADSHAQRLLRKPFEVDALRTFVAALL